MTTCPACAEAVAPAATKCPHCGEALRDPAGAAARWVGRSLVVPAAAVLPAAACLLCGADDGAAAVLPRRSSFFVGDAASLTASTGLVVRSLPLCAACARREARRRLAATGLSLLAYLGTPAVAVTGIPASYALLRGTAPRVLLVGAALALWLGALLLARARVLGARRVWCARVDGGDAWLDLRDPTVARRALGDAVPDRPPGKA